MLGRYQDAYDRFSAAVDGPLTVLAVLWLPVLVVPLVTKVSPATSAALARLAATGDDQALRCIR